jgi:prepilin-type N-terminal cleavage/methylation domain-containing protein
MSRVERRPRRDSRMGEAGMTIVELLVVVTIIGILIRIAYPAINSLRAHSESAMMTIGTTLQAAQREAVARQHDVIVNFNTASRSMQLIFDANNNGAQNGTERVRGVVLERTVNFGRGSAPARPFGGGPITFDNGLLALTFHRNGSASATGGLYVTTARGALAKWARDARAIEIVRSTGRIEWFRYNGTTWIRGF